MTTVVPGVEVSTIGKPEVVVFSVVGQIPPEHVSGAEELFRALIERGHRRFVIDLSRADYVSSNGVGIVVYYDKLLSKCRGRVVVVKAPPAVMERLGKFIIPALTVVDTRAEALALLGADERSAVGVE